MSVIAIFSLIMHAAAYAYPVYQYAITDGHHQMVGLHNYWGFGLRRNSGPFWEPGAFQIFLNFALYFDLYSDDPEPETKWIKFRRVCLILAVLSTVSTIGYVVLVVVCLKKMKDDVRKIRKPGMRILAWVGFLLMGVVMLVVLYQSDPIQKKFFEHNPDQ